MPEKIPTFTAKRWTPLEVSAVAIGADPAAGFRSAPPQSHGKRDMTTETIDKTEQPLGQRAELSTRQERNRVQNIRAFEGRLGRAFADQHIEAGTHIDQVREEALQRIMAEDAKAPTSNIRSAESYESPSFRTRAMGDALVHRLTGGVAQLPDQAREYRGLSLPQLAGEFLELAGVRTRLMSNGEIVTQAFQTRAGAGGYATHGTGDFPYFLQETGQRAIQALYEMWPAALKQVAARRTVRDFRTAKTGRVGEFPPLLPKAEHQEIEAGSTTEEAETYRVSTFARAFGLSREAMINDDLGMFQTFVNSVAMAVTDLEARLLTGLLTDNPAMADGYNLFSSEHANLATPAAISPAALSTARKLMRAQTGVNGEYSLNIGPRFLVVPAGLETTAEQILAPIYAADVDEVNPFSGALVPVVESRLDATDQSFFVMADPARMPAIAYVQREGAEVPQVETEYDFSTKGMAISVVYDFGVFALDWRGAVKTAPNG